MHTQLGAALTTGERTYHHAPARPKDCLINGIQEMQRGSTKLMTRYTLIEEAESLKVRVRVRARIRARVRIRVGVGVSRVRVRIGMSVGSG